MNLIVFHTEVGKVSKMISGKLHRYRYRQLPVIVTFYILSPGRS